MATPDKARQTPLEQLTEMNERVGKTRKKSARPRDPTAKIERYYRAQLRSLVRSMAKRVKEDVLPVVQEEKEEYKQSTGDSVPSYTADAWSDRVIKAIQAVAGEFISGIFAQQYERIARQTVSMAESETTEAFVKSVNEAVGVDMGPILDNEGMQDYVQAATQQNVGLIKSIPEEYFTGIESAVLGGIRDGKAPSAIASQIQSQTGVHERKARTIARDQTAKLTSEITERRQRQSGIKYYQSVTAGDERVTGKPGGKYPNAKISCWGIAKQDIGFGPGVYRWDKGATWNGQKGLHPGRHHINCRCTAKPIFEYELPEKAKK
jgi:SPP1 gp7 family putative phage head morphogenesis protein